MAEHVLPAGKSFGHYRIQGQLGAGGMGVVYSAYDTVLERKVAIKVVGDRVLADKSARDLLLHEARAASALNHPNICTIHQVGDSDGEAYIVMEHVEGQLLSSLVGAGGLSPELVIRYGTQIADALAHAHQHGVIHRDLKSTNALVTPEGRIKVLDFGLATRCATPNSRKQCRQKSRSPNREWSWALCPTSRRNCCARNLRMAARIFGRLGFCSMKWQAVRIPFTEAPRLS